MLSPIRYYGRDAARHLLPVLAGGRTRREPSVMESHLAERLVNPPSTRGYLQQLYAVTGWSSRGWLGHLRVPTLILHGDDDPLVPVANARWMATVMPGARLRVVHGAGHLFLIDEPESVAGDLVRFLSD
jgi:pimeloyl-ACP methyl ester carboxylesterase